MCNLLVSARFSYVLKKHVQSHDMEGTQMCVESTLQFCGIEVTLPVANTYAVLCGLNFPVCSEYTCDLTVWKGLT